MASETPNTCDRGAQLNLELTRGVVRKDAEAIGRIVRTASGPAGKPWMWSILTRQDSEAPSWVTRAGERPPCGVRDGLAPRDVTAGNRGPGRWLEVQREKSEALVATQVEGKWRT